MKELLKLIQQLGRKHDNLRVFQDFVEICACSISRPFINREDRYFAIYSRYTDEEMQQFHQMGQILLHELEKAPQDILGQCYMQLELANKQRGQCFTPPSIGNLMANCLFHQAIEQRGYYTLNEPTCGSGALIIAFCETMRQQGFNPQALLGIPAEIQHANPLTGEVMDCYFTPFYYLQGA